MVNNALGLMKHQLTLLASHYRQAEMLVSMPHRFLQALVHSGKLRGQAVGAETTHQNFQKHAGKESEPPQQALLFHPDAAPATLPQQQQVVPVPAKGSKNSKFVPID